MLRITVYVGYTDVVMQYVGGTWKRNSIDKKREYVAQYIARDTFKKIYICKHCFMVLRYIPLTDIWYLIA